MIDEPTFSKQLLITTSQEEEILIRDCLDRAREVIE